MTLASADCGWTTSACSTCLRAISNLPYFTAQREQQSSSLLVCPLGHRVVRPGFGIRAIAELGIEPFQCKLGQLAALRVDSVGLLQTLVGLFCLALKEGRVRKPAHGAGVVRMGPQIILADVLRCEIISFFLGGFGG